MQIEIQCSKNYFKICLSQEAGASVNNKEKESQKSNPKLKICMFQIFIKNICSASNLVQVVVFCKHILIL